MHSYKLINIKKIYSSFDENPLKVASIAQVHKAVLKENGQTVAVKVLIKILIYLSLIYLN